jgi:phosphotransferase system enzyme I (PtsI)
VRLTGLGVSPGVGVGKALVLKGSTRELRFRVAPALVARELDRLEEARARSRAQIEGIKVRIAQSGGGDHAYIFDAQLLMLDDAMLIGRAAAIIRSERLNAASALGHALDEISALFDEAQDSYLRERKGDVADVVGRLCMNLRAADHPADLFNGIEGPLVLVADEITPSVIAQLDWQRLAALVTHAGSWTYHTAILARSIGVPAVAGLHNASTLILPGALVAVDGLTGEVFVEPDIDTLAQVTARRSRRLAYQATLEHFRTLPAVTEDGVEIRLEANIESPGDAGRALERGATGIGLFRSEFLLAGGSGPSGLTEEAQYDAYRRLIDSAAPGRVTIRTFDTSETQLRLGHLAGEGARAPLGLRGIRLSLAAEETFQAQLAALLRAAAHGPLRIMFPFISGLEELRAARAAVHRAADALRARGVMAGPVEIGIMIEVPSAAMTADLLAREADFFSIGTNDLIQYCLAVDRTDDRVSSLYEPLHPAILRTIRLVARAGRHCRIPVAVCGEMASDPALLLLLIGLGLREFSMAPGAVPLAKQVLRSVRASDARVAARRALGASTVKEVERTLLDLVALQEQAVKGT